MSGSSFSEFEVVEKQTIQELRDELRIVKAALAIAADHLKLASATAKEIGKDVDADVLRIQSLACRELATR